MKNRIAIAALTVLTLSLAPCMHAVCTDATLAGHYGFTTTGTLILPTGPAPVAAVGVINFDLAGNATGSQSRSVGGAFAHETITGTSTVNPDCTFTLVANVYDDAGNLVRTSTIPAVLVNNGKKIRAMFETVVLPNGLNLPSALVVDVDRL